MSRKKRILTWLKPTWEQLHLGNYFWALKPIIDMQNDDENEIFLFIPNMHWLISNHDWGFIRKSTLTIVKTFIAVWADVQKFFIYNQSDIPAHAQLHRVLTCITHMWWMERMHAYKDKIAKQKANEVSVGLFTYPILMAADILLYDADIVPVWKDQKQHVEFARDIAEKFNKLFWQTFKLPEPYIRQDLMTIPWIDWRKMSKSYNNYIWLLEDEKTLLKKIRQIPTMTKTIEEPKNPDECNVYKILKLFLKEEENEQIRQKYLQWWLSFKEVKDYLFEKIWTFIKPIKDKFNQISDEEVKKLLQKNKQRANDIANQKIKDVYQKVGFDL